MVQVYADRSIMDELMQYYEEFQHVQSTYIGNRTNWEEKFIEHDIIYHKVKNTKIVNSKHSDFYNWVKRKLLREIEDEKKRVFTLALKEM